MTVARVSTDDLSGMFNILDGRVRSNDERILRREEIDLDRVRIASPEPGDIQLDLGFCLALAAKPEMIPEAWSSGHHSVIIFGGTTMRSTSHEIGYPCLWSLRGGWKAGVFWPSEIDGNPFSGCTWAILDE